MQIMGQNKAFFLRFPGNLGSRWLIERKIMKNNEEIEVKDCPICGEEKPIDQFRHGYAGFNQSALCLSCIDKMNRRLEAFIVFDKAACKKLELDYRRVTDYEAHLRKIEKFHREDGFNFMTDRCIQCKYRMEERP